MNKITEDWYFAEKMRKNFSNLNAAQISQVKKHLREYAEIREAMQRELCALQAYAAGANGKTLFNIRNAHIPDRTIINLKKQLAFFRELYKKEFCIVKEFQCYGKFLHHICTDVQVHKLNENERYIVRIFETGETQIFRPDKPSQFYNSLFTGNAENLPKIKKSLCHIHNMEVSSPVISKLKWNVK